MLKRFLFVFFALFVILSLVLSTVGCTEEKAAGPQVLTVNLAGEPDTIDPNKSSWTDSISVASQCFEGLLGFTKELELKAVVAKEIPTTGNGGISEDGKTYTFKLRSDVTWSDGEKVKAQDFEFAIKRMLSPELASEYASFYFDIVGAEDYNAGTGSVDDVAVDAVDDATLEIKLVNVRPTFLQLMAMWPTWPTREDIITQYGDTWTEPPHYIGNGPFILTEWVHQDHLTFEVNENYWGKKPKLEKMVFKMITDQVAELAAYKNNELDMSRVPTGSEKTIMDDPESEQRDYSLLGSDDLRLPVQRQQGSFRQRQRCARLFAPPSTGIPSSTRCASGVGKAAYQLDPARNAWLRGRSGQRVCSSMPPRPRHFLPTPGIANGASLPASSSQYANTAGNTSIAEFLQGQMKDNLGIDITLEPMEPKAFTAFVNTEQYKWACFGWGADYPDPDNWLPELFGTDAGNNHTNYSSAAFDNLCAEAAVELDNDERLAKYAEAQEILIEDVPIVPMFFRERFWLVEPSVKGLVTTGLDHTCQATCSTR